MTGPTPTHSDQNPVSGMAVTPSAAEALTEALRDADLLVEVHLWHPTFDPLTAPCWWQWRPPCDCPDTSFGRNPHRWNCDQTPAYVETVRAGYLPTMEFGS